LARKKIKAKEKPSRKDDLDPNKDQFITKTMTSLDWAYERRRPIALVLGVALVAAIAAIAVDWMLEQSRAEKSRFLGDGFEAALAPVIPTEKNSVTPPPANEDAPLTFETAKARATETLNKFKSAAKETDSSLKLASQVGIAAAHLDLGEYDKAITIYEAFLSSKDASLVWLRAPAIEGLCYALEAQGKLKEAKSKIESLQQTEKGVAANMARYHGARLAIKTNDKDTAKKLLKEVLDSYTETDRLSRLDYVFIQARERLLAIDPEAEVPDLPSSGMGGLDLNNIDPKVLEQLMRARQGAGAS